jgi:hypothetical protein
VARIRSIKPEFPQSESMGRVSRDARLLFVMLWTISDDHGRSRAHSRMLASLLFPYDDDAGVLLPKWMAELENEGCISLYDVGGSQYLQINNWGKHQKIDKPSKPIFPGIDDISEDIRESSRDTREVSSEDLRKGSKEGKGSAEGDSRDEPREKLPPVCLLPLNTGPDFQVTEDHLAEFKQAYPAVDVMQQLKAMRAWLIANPVKRKTKSGILRFVNAWLAKEQDNPSRARSVAESSNGNSVAASRPMT